MLLRYTVCGQPLFAGGKIYISSDYMSSFTQLVNAPSRNWWVVGNGSMTNICPTGPSGWMCIFLPAISLLLVYL